MPLVPEPPVDVVNPPQPAPPVDRTRVAATWMAISVGTAVLVLLIVFMMQNTTPVEVAFFGLRGTAPLALTLLIAGVASAVVALTVGTLRIGQLRRRIGADRRGTTRRAHAAADPGPGPTHLAEG
ncbi:LapA family protein [Cellulomonas citrea]|uniref:LapA family protein n=1 Tax=Cellulomonas citrea TaxID=1909423 RepID=UPI001915C2C0|nr:lipopolysaccharide assembly protein LapA domain-containing protein [Cellulomonas citrea]